MVQPNTALKNSIASAGSVLKAEATPEFYRRITDNFKRSLEHQGFSNFVIFSLLW